MSRLGRPFRQLPALLIILLLLAAPAASRAEPPNGGPAARNVILMIADGWGYKQIEATNSYYGTLPAYQGWTTHPMSTYPSGGSYDPLLAWSDPGYVLGSPTDSAAAATAMVTGEKTQNGRISVSATGIRRLKTLPDDARLLGKAVGAVTTVYASHATPGTWIAHNDRRSNGFAIADEGLWGDPNTTGDISASPYYGGGHGNTLPPVDVLLGAGHPTWNGGIYINLAIYNRLVSEAASSSKIAFVERVSGSPDAGARLLSAAANPATTRLTGLFGSAGGNLDWRLSDGSGANLENPTLAEMTLAALTVLNRDPDGFFLLVEGGAVDWAGHQNNMDRLVGEMAGFNEAVQAVSDWVSDPANGTGWDDTLVVITGDHETGYLAAGPQAFPDLALGEVSTSTLALEEPYNGTGLRASWEDLNGDDRIDAGETVYWAWNSSGHSNSLIPMFARGPGEALFASALDGIDPIRGPYLDNTAIHRAIRSIALAPITIYIPFLSTSQ